MTPFENPPGHFGIPQLHKRVPSPFDIQKPKPRSVPLHTLADQAWSELPYTLMRITAAKRPWDGNHLYWQDQTLQLGDIDLNLASSRSPNHPRRFTATYSLNELRHALTPNASRSRETRRVFTLHPSLEADEVRWTDRAIPDMSKLSTQQLAQRLLSKLVIFYTNGLR